jgi:hypothetical protein
VPASRGSASSKSATVTALGLDGPHGVTNGEQSPGTMSTFWTSSSDPGCGRAPSPDTSESPETACVRDPLPRMKAVVVKTYAIEVSWQPTGTETAKLSTASELKDVPPSTELVPRARGRTGYGASIGRSSRFVTSS